MSAARPHTVIALVIVVLLALLGATIAGWWWTGPGKQRAELRAQYTQGLATMDYVGRESCVDCHEPEDELWRGSHHDLAMDVADDETVIGNFSDVTFTHHGVESRLFHRDGKYFARTEGPDGQLADYEIKYVFGVTPLQQYLVEFPGGRLQTLALCWDARPAEEGGQRWFHIYGDEQIPPDDVLHWTGPNQNWNYMCAECHSTDLQKNYDLAADRYDTTWSEIDVSCEACHGPCSAHVAWAEADEAGIEVEDDGRMWVPASLKDPEPPVWTIDEETGLPSRQPPLASNVRVETCGRCHSRRTQIWAEYVYGRPLLDTHRVALLDEHLYFADGQILDEVYVYGSFLQSRMYHMGVTCIDCHDAHSMQVIATGNELCYRCHLKETYDTPDHHFHEMNTEGAACVDCHMPTRNYMVVDPRLDHSVRIPRPDLAVKLGIPDACTRCHDDQPTQWSVDAMDEWYGGDWRAEPHYGEALHAGRSGAPGARRQLERLAADGEMPAIVRATALSLLRDHLGPDGAALIDEALNDADPMVRWAAVGLLDVTEPDRRLRLAEPLLADPVRLVRLEAARVLAGVPAEMMDEAQRAAFDRAAQEFIASQSVNAERPESHVNIGVFHSQRGDFEKAEQAYRTAIRVNQDWSPAHVNLADLYRVQGEDDEGERILLAALEAMPDDASVHHALGLLLVRQRRIPEALEALGRAAELDDGNPRFDYVYAIALNSVGQPGRALQVLEQARLHHPNDQALLVALATISRDNGLVDAAVAYAERLVELAPDDEGYRRLLQDLRAAGGR